MYGRNGMDQMNRALLRGYLVILVAQLIFSLLRLWIPARICESLLWYFTCRCGAICRVPVGKGKIVITCPKCGAKIEAKS